jgi:hypothetical protein
MGKFIGIILLGVSIVAGLLNLFTGSIATSIIIIQIGFILFFQVNIMFNTRKEKTPQIVSKIKNNTDKPLGNEPEYLDFTKK